jgi:16S rRNA (guanine(1405)-N(7))-methyltransferase
VAVSYRERPIPFAIWKNELDELTTELDNDRVHTFLRSVMRSHVSTQERLPILESIFRETLQELPPVSSVLDLACGFNPLAIPWMPLAQGFQYFACDIYTDMLAFLNQYFSHFSINGSAFSCDLTISIPTQPVDLAIALKTIPCLEQVEKQVGTRLLEQVNARHLLVSFPAHSIGGKSKGMVRNYEMHFNDLVAGKPWQIKRFEFRGELVFLITK